MAGYDNISSNISLIVLIDSHAYKYGVMVLCLELHVYTNQVF